MTVGHQGSEPESESCSEGCTHPLYSDPSCLNGKSHSQLEPEPLTQPDVVQRDVDGGSSVEKISSIENVRSLNYCELGFVIQAFSIILKLIVILTNLG